MPRRRTGSVKFNKQRKALVARLDWVDEETGKRRCRKRQVANKTEGWRIVGKWIKELAAHGERSVEGDRLTFRQLASEYRTAKLIVPVYKGETKVAGLRSRRTHELHLRTLTEYFGTRKVRRITHADLEKFKLTRLSTRTRMKRERTLASVNRELALLRAILNFARRQGWIARNPFEMGDPLISLADEVKRERILSREEEERLLAACTGQRAHLRPVLICALDTGMRRGEMFMLKWSDIDIDAGVIRVKAANTKTQRARSVPITSRLRQELERLREIAPSGDGPVFGISDNVKKGFATACRLSGVENFRLHDCRHVATTRMIEAGMPPLQVMKITGHTQMTTFLRYMNVNDQTVRQAAQALDSFHAAREAKPELIN